MRTRVAISGGAVVGLTLFGANGVAWAQEDEDHQEEPVAETEEHAEEEPNPILPETNEIIWGALSFFLLFFLLAKYAFPSVKDAMDARSERIRNSLDEAERTRAEAQQLLDDYQRQVADARNEAGRIIEEARQAADQMRRELMAKAEADAQQVRERAQADIGAQVERATADLRAQVAQLSVEAAEMVVKNALKDRDTQLRLVEDYITQVGSGTGTQN